MPEVQNKPTETVKTDWQPTFGNGAYRGEIEKYFNALQVHFGISPKASLHIARQAAQGVNNALKSASREFKVGKANSDGKGAIAETCKTKGVTMTNPMSIVHAVLWLNDAGKHGISYGKTKWHLADGDNSLATYVAAVESDIANGKLTV